MASFTASAESASDKITKFVKNQKDSCIWPPIAMKGKVTYYAELKTTE